MDTSTPIIVSEVGLRDGLQSLSTIMPTAAKLAWMDAVYGAGIRCMEVGSFVNPKLLPGMADVRDVIAHAKTLQGLHTIALVPNLKGATAAFECGPSEVVIPISISKAHSQSNVRRSPEQMLSELDEIVQLRNQSAPDTRILVGLTTAFGCTLQGHVPAEDVLQVAEGALARGADGCAVGDTVGYANPEQVDQMIGMLRRAIGDRLVGAHFHNTRGLGLANTLVALNHGIVRHDSSLAGLGGCPYAPGASGNVVTEDLVFMLGSMGFTTGIDLEKLLPIRDLLKRELPDEPLHGFVAQAGLPINWATSYEHVQGDFQ